MINTDKDTIQEWFLFAGDQLSYVSKKLWLLLLFAVVITIPVYFAIVAFLVPIYVSQYVPPEVTPSTLVKEPLQIVESKILPLSGNKYSAYVKLRNINFNWAVEKQQYTVEFKTMGGTLITKVDGSVYILPSSDKLVVFYNFTADKKPEVIDFKFKADGNGELTKFIHPPPKVFTQSLERLSVKNPADGLVVSAAIKNLTPFTVRKIDLPVAVYDSKNHIVAVNYTWIQDVKPNESRTFQYPPWPSGVAGAIRAEINPQIDVFDPNIFQVSNSPVDNSMQ